ncbi:MAG: alpha/beta fold hydrolase [Thauera phenolivorans]|uniref:Alpha/beta fold hydrolase n=1 Tax=Thauera phenolivorans TaxID=1792543 RepID=A0A7X7LUD2_9RHOO|nr:alpha/beta fold hydrolase [Thauera phenolivorans]
MRPHYRLFARAGGHTLAPGQAPTLRQGGVESIPGPAPRHTRAGAGSEAIVLVHGLWMHGRMFTLQRRRLAARGYRVECFSYPSVRSGLDATADALARFIAGIDAARVHLAGHSLGGLVVLRMLARHRLPSLGRVVLLGAPCAGSNSATVLRRLPLLSAILGRAICEWLDAPPPVLQTGLEIGVIAGTRSLGLGRFLPGLAVPNDGVVAVSETRLAVATDSVLLPVGHTEMLFSRMCLEQMLAFVCEGGFRHG